MDEMWGNRLQAAICSGGVSSAPIYGMATSAIMRFKPDADAILDFGSGAGKFAGCLRQLFPRSEIWGADIMDRPEGIPPDISWQRGDLNHRLPIEDGRFDLISAIEVIEHLENPRHVLRELFRLLRPGGIALLTTPNTGSLRSLITFAVRGHHAQFDDSNYPAHITPLSETDFARAGTEAGFERLAFIYSDSGCIPKLLRYRWQEIPVIGPHLGGRRFSDNFGVVLRKPARG